MFHAVRGLCFIKSGTPQPFRGHWSGSDLAGSMSPSTRFTADEAAGKEAEVDGDEAREAEIDGQTGTGVVGAGPGDAVGDAVGSGGK